MKPNIMFVKVDNNGWVYFEKQEEFEELVEKIYEDGYKQGFKEGKAEGLSTPSTITTTTTTFPYDGCTIPNPTTVTLPYKPETCRIECSNDTKFFE